MSDSMTSRLIRFVQDSLKLRIVGFVPNHWHNDCTEGMDLLDSMDVPTYAHRITNQILKDNNLPQARHSFEDSLLLKQGSTEMVCTYLGPGHSEDNIVVWLPREKILFAGCMLKSAAATGLGHTTDAGLESWPLTL